MEETTTSTLGEPVELAPPSPVTTRTTTGFAPRKLWQRANRVSPFASNVALTVGANGLIALFGLATGPICARLLGPAGRGELAAIQNLYWFVGILAMLGMPEATLYFTAQKKQDGATILASSTILALLMAPLFALIAYLLVPLLLAAQSAGVIKIARLFLLAIPLYTLCTIPVFALRGRNDIARWNLLRLIPIVGWLLLLLGLWKFSRPDSATIAFGYLAVLAATLIATFLLTRKRVEGRFSVEPKRWPKMLRYGAPLAAAAIPFTLNVRLDQMIMAALLPASSLGIYVVAVSWSSAVSPALLAIGTVLFPRVAAANADDQRAVLAKTIRMGILVAVALVIVISALSPLAIPLLFGEAFRQSIPVAVVLVSAAGVLGMNIIFEEGLRGIGATSAVFWAEVSGLLVTALCLFLLLRPLGIMGAGIASLLGYLGATLILVATLKRRINVGVAALLVPQNEELSVAWGRLIALKDGVVNGGLE